MLRTLVALALLLPAAPALACGGFFCSNTAPVDQSGERILFAIDEANSRVEMHIQVQYTGPSAEFSWLLPTPTEPELLLSTEDVFSRLGWATAPSFVPTQVEVGNCVEGRNVFFASDNAVMEDGGGVTVTAQSELGPYNTTVLTATDVTALTTWLAENDYDLPPGGEAKLGAYVASGSYFVALKLRKDRDDGDLVPIALRFPGTDPIIPLQLTAVAAAPDMRIQPFVLGAARAVPENYLHVVVNQLAVDWTTAGANYMDVIARAADEAGGQAFATDWAGETRGLGIQLWAEGQYPIEGVRAVTDAYDLTNLLFVPFYNFGDITWQTQRQFPVGAGTLPILERFVDVPSEFVGQEAQFFSCINCYIGRGEIAVDGAGLAAALETEWLEPMRRTQDLVDRLPWLTRMTSAMSGEEMTVDPQFVLNPDLPAFSVGSGGTMEILCNGVHSRSGAPRRLVLADGTSLDLPSSDDAAEIGFTWESWIGEVGGISALQIEQMARSGGPELINDRTADLNAALASVNGCRCDGTGGSFSLMGLAGVVALARRRRS